MPRWMTLTQYYGLIQALPKYATPPTGVRLQLMVQAHLQKAKILAKEGRFDDAQAELKEYKKSKSDTESEELVGHARSTMV